jgi:hypothetical protein
MAKSTFSSIPPGIESMARAAPGGTEALGSSQATPEQPPAPSQPVTNTTRATGQPEAAQVEHPTFPVRRQASQAVNLRAPLALYEEIRQFSKLSDIPITEIFVEGARRELARLKKLYGVE